MSKKLIGLLMVVILILSLASCSILGAGAGNENSPTDDSGNSGDNLVDETPDSNDPVEKPDDSKPEVTPECNDGCVDADGDGICDRCNQSFLIPPEIRIPTIFLAGDSTVKTYEDGQYIAGWGQYLSLFLNEEITVINAAHGGRSSRSFINEGRLYDIPGNNYTFSQNGGNSIGDEIQAGDYLFIQFGHNDDASKLSNYTTIYDRMVPLGEPDANGIYPTTPAQKQPTTFLPAEYTSKATDAEEATALQTIAKYGDEYYAYGSGTYKWYLKQYIDFARSVGAIPVLVTPVARVKFSGNEIIGGAGLHGENFAYVEAVRQLAEEENCLLIDLFADSKTMLECATSEYANYLMALKPNELKGVWPLDYDASYGNTESGYTGIEATHYNKYGAFLQAAEIAEHILENKSDYSFAEYVLTSPKSYVDPSNLIGRNTVTRIEALFDIVNVTNPNRDYYDPQTVIDKIAGISTEVTQENYLEIAAMCEVARICYAKLNVDDRSAVINLATLEEIECKVREMVNANRPEPTKIVIFSADNLSQDSYTSTVVEGDFTLVATADKKMDKKSSKVNFSYGDEIYSLSYGLSVGGKASFGSNRYISFTTDGPCTITVAVRSSGTDTRTLTLVDSSHKTVGSFEAPSAVAVSSVEINEAGTYSVGSAGSGMYVYMIIIEYFE